MNEDYNDCDYCGGQMGRVGYMRAVGFTDFEGTENVLVKTWCGDCDTPDDIDHEANNMLRNNLAQQGRQRPPVPS